MATVTSGQTANYNLQLSPSGGFNGSLSMSCSGAPAAATCTCYTRDSDHKRDVVGSLSSQCGYNRAVVRTSRRARRPVAKPTTRSTLPRDLLAAALAGSRRDNKPIKGAAFLDRGSDFPPVRGHSDDRVRWWQPCAVAP